MPWKPSRRAALRGAGIAIASGIIPSPVPAQSSRFGPRGGAVEAVDGEDALGRFRRPRIDRPLPDGRLVRGRRNIAAAWLSDPTQRYRHFVLGTEHEAETLVVSLADRRVLKLKLDPQSVFEDREPRLADLDGDGEDEIVVVRSYLKTGAALAVIKVKGEALEIIAETPPTGQPHTWINPAAVADLDGDGRPELALVRLPHVLGELEIWNLKGGELVERATMPDVSNHVRHSRHLNLAAVGDFDGDSVADLAVPSLDRRTLRFLSFKGGRFRELTRVALPAPAAESFKVVASNGRPAVLVGLTGGRTHLVSP